jgi:tripartite-type tricarboxylate transporter receptor subunit TctC
MTKTFLQIALAAAGVLGLTGLHTVHAQNAARSLTIIVPQPAGNPTDGVARKLQPLLQKELGTTVIVENLPGAGGSLGTQRVLNAPTDGNTVLIASQTEPILTPFTLKHVKYKPEDFKPIALAARLPYILVGRAGLPASNLAELAALAKKQGATPLSLGHVGPGSMIHLIGEQWARKNGVTLNPIAYKGVPPITQDIMGGQIDLTFLPLGGTTLQAIESGKVRAFGTTGASATVQLPRVPPIAESNKSMADYVYGTWIALLVPAKTPDATIERLNNAFSAVMKDKEFQSYVAATGMELATNNTIAELNKFYASESAVNQNLARTIGVEPN